MVASDPTKNSIINHEYRQAHVIQDIETAIF